MRRRQVIATLATLGLAVWLLIAVPALAAAAPGTAVLQSSFPWPRLQTRLAPAHPAKRSSSTSDCSPAIWLEPRRWRRGSPIQVAPATATS